MNKMTWIGTIVWGAFVACFGLTGIGAVGSEIQPQDVMFLIAGGAVSCLIGVVGLMGFIGWLPGMPAGKNVQNVQKSYS